MRTDAIFCDDVRPEASGKQILIGVYPNDLVSHVTPSTFPLALWIRLHGLKASSRKFELKLKSDDGATDLDLSGELFGHEAGGPSVIALGGFPVSVQAATTLRAFLAIDGEDATEIATLPIKVSPSPPTFNWNQK